MRGNLNKKQQLSSLGQATTPKYLGNGFSCNFNMNNYQNFNCSCPTGPRGFPGTKNKMKTFKCN